VAGIDEAGRGPLAGPVVAAACIIPADVHLEGIDDSKAMSEQEREQLYAQITSHPRIVWAAWVARNCAQVALQH
jgi:ribonuclease HII